MLSSSSGISIVTDGDRQSITTTMNTLKMNQNVFKGGKKNMVDYPTDLDDAMSTATRSTSASTFSSFEEDEEEYEHVQRSSCSSSTTSTCCRRGSVKSCSDSATSKRRRKSKNGHVAFHDQVRVRTIPSSGQLADDARQLWYQEDEYDKIRERSIKLIHFVEKQQKQQQACGFGIGAGFGVRKVPCIRGLEHLFTESHRVKSYLRRLAYESVLSQQDCTTTDEEDIDEESISNLYQCVSRPNVLQALQRAQQDAMDVRN